MFPLAIVFAELLFQSVENPPFSIRIGVGSRLVEPIDEILFGLAQFSQPTAVSVVQDEGFDQTSLFEEGNLQLRRRLNAGQVLFERRLQLLSQLPGRPDRDQAREKGQSDDSRHEEAEFLSQLHPHHNHALRANGPHPRRGIRFGSAPRFSQASGD